jgi:hypothetical protein
VVLSECLGGGESKAKEEKRKQKYGRMKEVITQRREAALRRTLNKG